MVLLVMAILVTGFVLYLVTLCFKSCCFCLYRVAQRLLKEVLLTLILFNSLNFAYTAGIHFKYAPKEDSLFVLGTIAAILTIILPIFMAFALECTE